MINSQQILKLFLEHCKENHPQFKEEDIKGVLSHLQKYMKQCFIDMVDFRWMYFGLFTIYDNMMKKYTSNLEQKKMFNKISRKRYDMLHELIKKRNKWLNQK